MPEIPVKPGGRRSVLSHREGRWILGIGDLTALVVPALLATLQRHPERPVVHTTLEITTAFIALVIWAVLAVSANLYSLARASSVARTQRATLCAVLVVFAAIELYKVPGGVGAWTNLRHAAYAVVAVGLWRTAFAYFAKLVPFTRRILAVGAGVSGGLIAEEMHGRGKRGERDYELVGFVDDDPNKVGAVHVGFPVVGASADLERLIELHQIDTLVVCVNSSRVNSEAFQQMVLAREKGVRIVSMPVLYEDVTEKIAVEHVGENWGIMFPVEHNRSPFVHDVLVRCVDIVGGIVGCVITALVCPVLMVVNHFFGNRGPLFYSQIRVGKGGRPFRIYKFRSMVTDAEAAGAKWCTVDDPRITKVGNLLRKTRLDELPQFWNVLKGEMSIIGPRPERPEFVSLLAESIPFFRARNAVKPGLTGWAQVMYRYGSSEEDSLIKLQYDLYYIKHRSPAIDLRIVAKSVKVIATGAGR